MLEQIQKKNAELEQLNSDLKKRIDILESNNKKNNKRIKELELYIQTLQQQKIKNEKHLKQIQDNITNENNKSKLIIQNYKNNIISSLQNLNNTQIHSEEKNNDNILDNKRYKDLLEELKKEKKEKENLIKEINLQINTNEIEKTKFNDKINLLNYTLKQKEKEINIAEKEIENLSKKNYEIEKVIKEQMENIKELYKEKLEKEIKKIKDSLMKNIQAILEQNKNKYTKLYENREIYFYNKFNELGNFIMNSQLNLNRNKKIYSQNDEEKILFNINNNIPKENNNNQNSELGPVNTIRNHNSEIGPVNLNDNINSELGPIKRNINQNYNNPFNNKEFNNLKDYQKINNNYNINAKNSLINTNSNVSGNNQSSINNYNHITFSNHINERNSNSNNITFTNDNKKNNEGNIFECTNLENLKVYIYQGTDEARFDIYLKNIGIKRWDNNTKLILDKSSYFSSNEIILAPQKPKEERCYEIVIKDLRNYLAGSYKIMFLFFSGGNIYGDKIIAIINIIEKDNTNSEIGDNNEEINDFTDNFNLI